MLEAKDHRDALGRELKPGDLVMFSTSDYFMPGVILNSARCLDMNVRYIRKSKGFTNKRKPARSLLQIDESQLNQMIGLSSESLVAILELQTKVKNHLRHTRE